MNNFIMVGGMSGAGKTSLVSSLTKMYPQCYRRPVSFTSRDRREDESTDEYIFSTKNQMLRMKSNNEFVNFDIVYGNYYAMTRASIDLILECGVSPIKEIHPQNFACIKQSYPNSVTVLIRSNLVKDDDSGRKAIDVSYYDNLDDESFNVTFFNDRSLSVFENAHYLHLKIQSYLKYALQYPSRAVIDSLNKKGYGTIAREFTDAKRITTHNFHTLTHPFFQKTIERDFVADMNVLEVGPGHGWLRSAVTWPNVRYTALELSIEMSEYFANNNRGENIIISSIANNIIGAELYDAVICSLADPYFYPQSLCEINRVLKKDGIFIFSLPAADWAEYLRKDNKNFTQFIADDGKVSRTYSFVLPENEINELLDDCGFMTLELSSLNAETLYMQDDVVSPSIVDALNNKKCNPSNLDVVTVGVATKVRKNNE